MTESNVRDDYILFNGLRFHYREWPSPGNQALLLLHGFTGHARSWDSFARLMQPSYNVIALDQRGHGESGWTEDYSPEAMVDDIDRFVRALGLRAFVLLGLSMGGRNAYHYAAAHTGEVERLVIVDIGPDIAPAGSSRIRSGVESRDTFDTFDDALAALGAANPNADPTELRHRTRENMLRTEDGRWTFRYDARLRRPGGLGRPDPGAAWDVMPKLTMPTLLVRGELSDVLAPETAERMVRDIPDCRFVEVAGSGHSIPLERPAGFLDAVRSFL